MVQTFSHFSATIFGAFRSKMNRLLTGLLACSLLSTAVLGQASWHCCRVTWLGGQGGGGGGGGGGGVGAAGCAYPCLPPAAEWDPGFGGGGGGYSTGGFGGGSGGQPPFTGNPFGRKKRQASYTQCTMYYEQTAYAAYGGGGGKQFHCPYHYASRSQCFQRCGNIDIP